jgi:hypothetical protein
VDIKKTLPATINKIIKEYSMILNCSPILLTIRVL